uniref:Mannosyl-oligosaccharide glucosidase n=1 Tax=Podarcis muralis TaxID=64176 RepID=A0A670JK55_PODMU
MARERRRPGPEAGRRPAEKGPPRAAAAAIGARKGRGAAVGAPGQAVLSRSRLVAVLALGSLALGLAAVGYGVGARRWRAARVLSLHPAPRILDANSSGPQAEPGRFWGSYRPQVYFGMKARSPRSPVAGLMWMHQLEGDVRLRHTCEQSDGLPRYGWLLHDGVNFGVQEIQDVGLSLQTEFVKRPGGQHGGDWSWRVTVRPELPLLGPCSCQPSSSKARQSASR